MELQLSEIESSVMSEVNKIFSTPNQRRCRKEPALEFKDESIKEEKQDVST